MFGSIGMPELIIILTLALIIFGPRKLPELGRSLGKSLGEFKRASNELRNTLDEEIRIEDERTSAQKAATPQRPADTAPVSDSSSDSYSDSYSESGAYTDSAEVKQDEVVQHPEAGDDQRVPRNAGNA